MREREAGDAEHLGRVGAEDEPRTGPMQGLQDAIAQDDDVLRRFPHPDLLQRRAPEAAAPPRELRCLPDPLIDHFRSQVDQLRTAPQLVGGAGAEDGLPHIHRRRVPDPRFAGRMRQLRDRRRLTPARLHIAVEVLDRLA